VKQNHLFYKQKTSLQAILFHCQAAYLSSPALSLTRGRWFSQQYQSASRPYFIPGFAPYFTRSASLYGRWSTT